MACEQSALNRSPARKKLRRLRKNAHEAHDGVVLEANDGELFRRSKPDAVTRLFKHNLHRCDHIGHMRSLARASSIVSHSDPPPGAGRTMLAPLPLAIRTPGVPTE
jgi:hypothetical protein